MKHFKNEFRKTYSLATYIIFYALVAINIIGGFIAISLSEKYGIGLESPKYKALSYSSATTTSLIGIIVIFSIISISNTFSIDYSKNTWKNLKFVWEKKFLQEVKNNGYTNFIRFYIQFN